MKKLVIGLLALVALTGVTPSAQAWVDGTFIVDWTNTVGFSWKFDGVAQATANNGIAVASFNSAALGQVWCVDLFNHTNYHDVFSTRQLTQADVGPNTTTDVSAWNWINPTGDGDDKRGAAGLGQAAWLANVRGTQAETQGWALDKKLALQMAIWTAAYQGRFAWVSGGGINVTDFNGFLADIGATTGFNGQTSTTHRWYDNNAAGNVYQDFIDNDVPEPGSLLLLGGVLLGAAAAAWRKRSQA